MQRVALLFISCLLYGHSYIAAQIPDSAWYADYFSRFRLPDKQKAAFDSLEIVRAIAEKNNYHPAICRYYIEKAGIHLSHRRTDSAVQCFYSAIAIAHEKNLEREEGDAYLGLANFYQFNGNTLESAKYYLQAARLLKGLGRKRLLISLYRNFHSTLNKLKQKNGALENMLSAIAAQKNSESDLVKIINTKSSEEEGLNFPDQTLIREGGRDAIYVIFGNAKFPVNDFGTLASYGASRDVQRIPAGTASLIPDFPRNGSILREFSGDPKVYLVKNNMLYHIYNPDVLENYGSWDAVYFVPNGSLSRFPKADIQVTQGNMNTLFNLRQEFDNLADSINSALQKNSSLSNELSRTLAEKNTALQKRKTLLWVSAVGLVALLIIVFLLVRNFHQKQRMNAQSLLTLKKQEELERKTAIEKERTRIATDMHDDLGAGLSRIKFLSETIGIKKQQQVPVEEDISKIREYSHEMIDKMGEIVWALNEKNDSLSDLLSYVRSYAMDYLSQNGIACQINMPDDFSEQPVSGELRRNIYLAVKEALHNIVKHAGAKKVVIDIKAKSRLSVTINDDGVGFTGNSKPFSNGLINMRERMKDINGSFEIENRNGTIIKLEAPLPA